MRITNQALSENIVRQVQQLATRQARLQTQVATGQRIFQPEDDPSAVGRVLDLASEQRRITQYARNADRALAVSQATFSGLQQMKRLSDRATEIAVLGAGAINGSAAGAYAAELDQLLEQAVQVANSRLGSEYLFAGTAVGSPAFAAARDANGRIATVDYAGNVERALVPLAEQASLAPGSTGETNLALGDFMRGLIQLRDRLAAGDTAAVSTLQEDLVASEDSIVSALAEHGAGQTRIEASRAAQQDRSASIGRLVSAETEADLPSTIVKLNQTQTAYQAALQSGASIMRLSLLDYLR